MDVRDEVTKNTELFVQKFSEGSDANRLIEHLKKSDKVIFMSTKLLAEWRIEINAFLSALRDYEISYGPMFEASFSHQKFHGVLICSNTENLNAIVQMYKKAYRERANNTMFHS